MKEILLTQGYVALVDDEDYEFIAQWRWYYAQGYAKSIDRIEGKQRLMHRVLTSAPTGTDVDHANMDRLDNRRSNLRVCTRSQNLGNRSKTKGNTSGYKGVVKETNANTWKAQITCGGKSLYIGGYKTKEEAAKAYNEKAKELFGPFAKIN